MTIFGPDNQPLRDQDDLSTYRSMRGDITPLAIVWRGSNVLILTDREMIKRFSFDDKRKISDVLRKVFERDFGVLL